MSRGGLGTLGVFITARAIARDIHIAVGTQVVGRTRQSRRLTRAGALALSALAPPAESKESFLCLLVTPAIADGSASLPLATVKAGSGMAGRQEGRRLVYRARF
jgi:hypothetical protein